MTRLKKMGNENGIALATVVVTGVVLMMLTGATMTYAVNEMDISRHDQDWNAALAAAEAGIDDYIFRVNNDSNYWAWENNDPDNTAFTEWTAVPGTSNEGSYRYRINNDHIGLDGTVDVSASGRVGDVVRTISGTVRPRHFLDFLYFTDYETLDPIVYPILYNTSESWANSNCVRYKFGSPARNNSCQDIQFAAGDIIKGPLHTNDAMLIGPNVSGKSAQFRGDVTTNWQGVMDNGQPRRWWYNNSKPNPQFTNASDPRFVSRVEMPVAVTELRAKAVEDGCLYKGPTRIVLKSGGAMDVESPLSQGVAGYCQPGTNRAIPHNGVIYVDNSSTGSCQSNGKNRLGYPINNDLTDYDCRAGDVFVKGALKGRLTIASKNRLVITDDLTYATSDSLLGLIGENTVEVYHPVDCTSTSSSCDLARETRDGGGFFSDATIHAAILSLKHSFYVQNFNRGSHNNLDSLIVVGAIAQKFRGAVGTGGGSPTTGYLKDYTYDQRLKYIAPPEFLDPVNSAWQVATWAEMTPAYRCTGSGCVANS